jgi:hypothetical protein
MVLLEYILLIVIVVIIVLLYQGIGTDSRNRGFHSESEGIKYRAMQEAERITNEERERARQKASQARRYYP